MNDVEEAGGIVFRVVEGQVHILLVLVRAKQKPEAWIFPKGHVEAEESFGAAALRASKNPSRVDFTFVMPVASPCSTRSCGTLT